MIKKYQDEIPPVSGRVYGIESMDGDLSRIIDATQYLQAGVEFKAEDICATCLLECAYAHDGKVHALTTPNNSAENIKFYATSPYKRGDTFTFNGTPMVAITMDGYALDSNFFKAGCMVECRVRNGVLFFNSRSTAITDDTDPSASFRFGFENGHAYIEDD